LIFNGLFCSCSRMCSKRVLSTLF